MSATTTARQDYLLFGALVLLSLLAACAPPQIPAEKQCIYDSDCVPATCCHPNDAVSKSYAPDCTGLLCTQECVPGTIDCGQGEIRCAEGKCQAVLVKE